MIEREHALWVEKYRPKTIADCILPPRLKDFFQAQVSAGDLQNMLLVGGAGCGKTTAAKAMCNEMGIDFLFMNASEQGGIETLRTQIRSFASAISFSGGNHRCVILDEADYLNPSSTQPALRGFIEEFSRNCFHRSTKIITVEYGPIEIEEILNQTVTVRCKDGVWRPASVHSYGVQDLYEYEFAKVNSKGVDYKSKVIATENHRWFLKSGDETTNLKLQDQLLMPPRHTEMNVQGVIHGIIFGDGSGHRYYSGASNKLDLQGDKTASIRVCKKGELGDEICEWLTRAGFVARYHKHCGDDPCFTLGNQPGIKDLPHTTDPDYIAGFIYGWWLTDGDKTYATRDRFRISTIRDDAVNWLKEWSSYAGYRVSGHSIDFRKDGGVYPNAKPLHAITLNSESSPVCRKKEYWGRDEVFCLEEPVTHSFVLANGLLTGNCRFILTANFGNRILDPIKSRCAVVDFTLTKDEKKYALMAFNKRVQSILETENVAYDKVSVADVIKRYFPDYRKILNELQRNSFESELRVGQLSSVSEDAVREVMGYIKDRKFLEIRKWVANNPDIDFYTLVKMLFDKMLDWGIAGDSLPDLVETLSDYEYKRAFIMNPEIHITAMLVHLMMNIQFK